MSLHNLSTTITPDEHAALSYVLNTLRREKAEQKQQALRERRELSADEERVWDRMETAQLWLAAQSERFYEAWNALPAGSHLKEAYSDQVWEWSDRDLVEAPDVDPADVPNFAPPVRPE